MSLDKKKYPAKKLGKLPIKLINRVLKTELDEGDVWLSSAAHKHIAVDHPDDYRLYFSYVETALLTPTFIGQAANHSAGFEIVYRVPITGSYILIAISITQNPYGSYNIKSMYSLKEKTVTSRRNAKRLFPVN